MTSVAARRPLVPIQHRKKADLAYDQLRELIINGTYAPGQRMTLAELAGDLGLSQMPIREALVRLRWEGLLEGEPHKGMRVAPLSLRDAGELFEVRRELEGLAARLACEADDPTLADDLETINATFERAHAARDFPGMGRANWDFHRRILAAAGSGQLSRALEDVWTGSLRYRLGYQRIPGRARQTIGEHAAVIAAIRRRDPAAARAAAREHIRRAGVELAATLIAETGEATP